MENNEENKEGINLEYEKPKEVVQEPEQKILESVPEPRPKPLPTNDYFPEEPKINKTSNPYKIIAIVLVIMLFTFGTIWALSSFDRLSKKDFSSEIINNIDTPDVPVSIENQYTHEIINNGTTIVNVDLGDFAQEIADKVLEELNITNSS